MLNILIKVFRNSSNVFNLTILLNSEKIQIKLGKNHSFTAIVFISRRAPFGMLETSTVALEG